MRFSPIIVGTLLAVSIVLAVAPANPGDLNSDNIVNVNDVFVVMSCLGQNAATCNSGRADPNNDNQVNIFDFVYVAQSWGRTYTAVTQLTVTITDTSGSTSTVLAQWPAASGAASYNWATGRSENVAWDINGQTPSTSVTFNAPLLATQEDGYFCYEAFNSQGTSLTSQCTPWVMPAAQGSPGPGDTTNPTVSITAPTAGSTVSSTTTVTATASDNVGVVGVQFRIDGNNLGSEDTSSPYSVSLNPASYSSGSHALSAVARDAAGNTATSANIAITINNTVPDTTAPTATITAPTAGQTLTAGTTSISLTVTTNEAATCRWSTSNQAYSSMPNTFTTTGSTAHSTTLTGLSNGNAYTRYVRCMDTSNNAMTASQSVTFSVANPAAVCGNGVIEGTEQCDGSALGGATCQSRGFTGGTLSCSASCTFNTNACTGQNLYPNKPANYVTLSELDLSQTVPSGTIGNERYLASPYNAWSVIFDGPNATGGSDFMRVTDDNAPQSPPYIWRVQHTAGSYGGGIPGQGQGKGFGNLGRPLPSANGYYLSVWVKWSENFYTHPVSHKFVFSEPNLHIQYALSGRYLRASDETIGQAYEPQITTQPTLGQWHHLEVHVQRGNPGIVRVWLDGQLRTEHTNLPVGTAGTLNSLTLESHLGGGGYVLTEDTFFWMDHIYIAVPS